MISLNTIGSAIGTSINQSIKFLGRGASGALGLVSGVIASAYQSLGFNRSHADTFGAWYVSKTPTGKTITDETPGHKDRTELATTGSVFNGIDQCFSHSGKVTSDGLTELTLACRIKKTGLDNESLLTEYDSNTPQRSVRFQYDNGKLEIILSDNGALDASHAKRYRTVDDLLSDGNWHHVAMTWSGASNEIFLFVDGMKRATEVVSGYDAAITSLHNTTADFNIGAQNSGTGGFLGATLSDPAIWESTLTPAQIRDLYLKKLDSVPTPDHAWHLDGPVAQSLVGGTDLTPNGDPSAYSGSEGSTWLNDQGWNTTAYKSDFSEGVDGWNATSPSAREVVDFEGRSNVIKYTGGDEGAGVASSERLQNNTSWDNITDAQTYTLKFDIYIPSTNANLDSIKFSSSILGSGASYIPAPDTWETFTLEGETANISNNYIRFYAADNGVVSGITAGDVFYITNIEVIAEESVYPKRWDADLSVSGYAGDANSFGPVKKNREYRNGPSINLNGTDQYGVKPNSIDWSDKDFIFRIRVQPDAVGADYRIFTQDDTTTNIWISLKSTGEWATHQDGAWRTWYGITNPIAGKSYLVEIAKVGTSHTITVTNLTDGLAPESQTLVFDRGSTTGDFLIGCNRSATNNHFDGKIWGIEIEHASGVKTPVSEEVGIVSHDTLNPESPIAWQGDPTWDFTANDSYFHGETVGYSAVPIFVDGVELYSSSSANYDGLKTASLELDFLHSDSNNGETLYTNGSISPIRVRVLTGGIQVAGRDSTNSVASTSLTPTFAANTVVKWRVDIVEGDDPTAESAIYLYDRESNELLASATGLDLTLNQTSNSGTQQIGSYATATQSFLGDLYRVRHVAGGVEKLLWTADNHLVNQTDDSAMTENGGTLGIKKIPAASKALDANGYPTTNPAGPYHNRTAAEVTETPVANSDSVNPTYYGASFDNTLDANINADTNVTGFPFSIACDVKLNSTSLLDVLVFVSPNNAQYFGLQKQAGGVVQVLRRGDGVGPITKSTGFSVTAGQWHSTKVTLESATSFSVEFDGVTETFTGETSVSFPIAATTDDLWIGQYRSSLGETPSYDIKNVIVKQGDTVVNDLPLYKDALGREAGDDPKHGTLSATGVSFLTNAMETDLNPDIAAHENRAVTTGDRKIISIGAR